MSEQSVNLAYAKAHLSELTERAAAGDEIVITKRGQPVGRLSAPERPRRAVDLRSMREVTESMPAQPEQAGEFLRALRDDGRY